MQTIVTDVLGAEDLRHIREGLKQIKFIDGSDTGGLAGRSVKNNLQAVDNIGLRKFVHDRIMANSRFRSAVRPRGFNLLFSRYTSGMYYGRHIDNPLMEGPLRTDVAFTLFLADPDTYEGGELVLEGAANEQPVKLPAGSLFAYPATTFHRVNTVTRGERLAAVGWAMSMVRDASCRELLFDLQTARDSIFERDGRSETFDLVAKSLANLQRMWLE